MCAADWLSPRCWQERLHKLLYVMKKASIPLVVNTKPTAAHNQAPTCREPFPCLHRKLWRALCFSRITPLSRPRSQLWPWCMAGFDFAFWGRPISWVISKDNSATPRLALAFLMVFSQARSESHEALWLGRGLRGWHWGVDWFPHVPALAPSTLFTPLPNVSPMFTPSSPWVNY